MAISHAWPLVHNNRGGCVPSTKVPKDKLWLWPHVNFYVLYNGTWIMDDLSTCTGSMWYVAAAMIITTLSWLVHR